MATALIFGGAALLGYLGVQQMMGGGGPVSQMATLYFFASPTCPHCTSFKPKLAKYEADMEGIVEVQELILDSRESQHYAKMMEREYSVQIRAVPSAIFVGPHGEKLTSAGFKTIDGQQIKPPDGLMLL